MKNQHSIEKLQARGAHYRERTACYWPAAAAAAAEAARADEKSYNVCDVLVNVTRREKVRRD